jgi:hypothetical protein
MSFQDYPGDTMNQHGAGLTPLVGYGADSTLDTSSGSDAIPTSVTMPAGGTPAMGAPEPTGSPQSLGGPSWSSTGSTMGSTMGSTSSITTDATDLGVEDLDQANWTLQRASVVAGIVATGLATGAGIAWFILARRRKEQNRRLAAQSRGLLKFAPPVARPRLSDAVDSGAAATDLARQTAREASEMDIALADAAVAMAQDALERAQAIRESLFDQTSGVAHDAQGNLLDTWSKTRDTASSSWKTASQAARAAYKASRRTANAARDAALQTAQTARDQSAKTAKVARRNYNFLRSKVSS